MANELERLMARLQLARNHAYRLLADPRPKPEPHPGEEHTSDPEDAVGALPNANAPLKSEDRSGQPGGP
jgi:hypothetical protein